jgi:hypothetical protein
VNAGLFNFASKSPDSCSAAGAQVWARCKCFRERNRAAFDDLIYVWHDEKPEVARGVHADDRRAASYVIRTDASTTEATCVIHRIFFLPFRAGYFNVNCLNLISA